MIDTLAERTIDSLERDLLEAKMRAASWERRACAAESELAVTLAVLHDLGEERGASWVSLALRQRADVLRWLSCRKLCLECSQWERTHLRDCALAELLRAIGGPEETQRQVDAAHDKMLQVERMRRQHLGEWPMQYGPPGVANVRVEPDGSFTALTDLYAGQLAFVADRSGVPLAVGAAGNARAGAHVDVQRTGAAVVRRDEE